MRDLKQGKPQQQGCFWKHTQIIIEFLLFHPFPVYTYTKPNHLSYQKTNRKLLTLNFEKSPTSKSNIVNPLIKDSMSINWKSIQTKQLSKGA